MAKKQLLLVVGLTIAVAVFARVGWASYSNGELSTVVGSDIQVAPGQASVFLGRITLPVPDTDSIVINGVTTAIAAGNALSAFSSNEYFIDVDRDELFEAADGVVSSANAYLSSDDTVTTAPAGVTLATMGGTESVQSMYGFVDADSDGNLDEGEDIFRQLVSGGAETLTTGDTLELVPANEIFFVKEAGAADYDFAWGGAVLHFVSSNNQFNIVQSGKMNFLNFTVADNVCIRDSDASGDYTPGEIIWRDLNGSDCSAFNTGTDVILTGEGEFTVGTSLEITGSEPGFSFGYTDVDDDGVFDCSRLSCEGFIAAVADYADGAVLSPSDAFILSPANQSDSISVTGTAALEDPENLLNAIDVSPLTMPGGEPRFAYIDTNNNNSAVGDDIEDVVMMVASGNADTLSNGDVFRAAAGSHRYIDADANSGFAAADGDTAIISADTDLDIGALNGTGTDHIVAVATIESLTAFPANTKYHDHNNSGAYIDGDDIIRDIDGSTYYNADDLTAIALESTGSLGVTDDDIASLYVYGRSNTSCSDAGNTLLGTKASAPFLNTSLALTRSPITTSETVVLCLYADIAEDATPGRVFTPRFGLGDIVFSSGASPTDTAVTLSAAADSVNIVKTVNASVVPATSIKSRTTTYTVGVTTTANIPVGGGVQVIFPNSYTLGSTEMTCTADDIALSGTANIVSRTATFTVSGSAITAGSAIECAVTSVTNPSDVGETDPIVVRTATNITDEILAEIDESTTVTIQNSVTGGGHNYIAPQPERITLQQPSNDDVVNVGEDLEVRWENGGGRISPYVNVVLKNEQGEVIASWLSLQNIGKATVRIPRAAQVGVATVRIEATDLLTVSVTDERRIAIAFVSDFENISACDEESLTYTRPDFQSSLIKTKESPTVFYRSPSGVLRPFFSEQLFFSWGLTFNDIKEVPASILSNDRMGAPMPPRTGNRFGKITSCK